MNAKRRLQVDLGEIENAFTMTRPERDAYLGSTTGEVLYVW
jgi:hypothetical protein